MYKVTSEGMEDFVDDVASVLKTSSGAFVIPFRMMRMEDLETLRKTGRIDKATAKTLELAIAKSAKEDSGVTFTGLPICFYSDDDRKEVSREEESFEEAISEFMLYSVVHLALPYLGEELISKIVTDAMIGEASVS